MRRRGSKLEKILKTDSGIKFSWKIERECNRKRENAIGKEKERECNRKGERENAIV